jgi:hypothetical protein
MTDDTTPPPLGKPEAIILFRQLVAAHGLRWGPSVPASAYADLQRVSEVLSPEEKRAALRPDTR